MKKFLIPFFVSSLLLGACGTAEAPGVTDSTSNTDTSMTQDSGLKIEDLTEGTGAAAKAGDTLSMNYLGTFEDGTKFDSSYDRNQAFEFTLGAGQVIQGWDEGIVGMKVGGKRKLTIPSDLAYGDNGIPGAIPGGATLIFEVELLEIE